MVPSGISEDIYV
jgi:hypothetical protein